MGGGQSVGEVCLIFLFVLLYTTKKGGLGRGSMRPWRPAEANEHVNELCFCAAFQ